MLIKQLIMRYWYWSLCFYCKFLKIQKRWNFFRSWNNNKNCRMEHESSNHCNNMANGVMKKRREKESPSLKQLQLSGFDVYVIYFGGQGQNNIARILTINGIVVFIFVCAMVWVSLVIECNGCGNSVHTRITCVCIDQRVPRTQSNPIDDVSIYDRKIFSFSNKWKWQSPNCNRCLSLFLFILFFIFFSAFLSCNP